MAVIDNTIRTVFSLDSVRIRQLKVYTSAETQEQTYYRATPIGAVTTLIEVDINAPSGLYNLSDSGDYQNQAVRYEIAYRCTALSPLWTVYKYEISAATPDEIGFTHTFEVPEGSYDICVYRTSSKSNESQIIDKVYCNGIKSVIAKPVSYPDVTTILMRITGDKVLSEMNENQLSTIWKRKLPDINSGELEKTLSLAPAIKYIISNSKYPDILDNDSLIKFDKIWTDKGLNLNGVLDKDNTLLEVLKDILNVGFSEPIVAGGKLSFTQQGYKSISDITYIFQPQNITASPNLTVTLPQSDDTQEICAEYMDPTSWKTNQIYIHATDSEGNIAVTTYPTSKYQDKISLFGVTSKSQAVSMAARRLNYLKYTKFSMELKTELEGLNVSYNDFVGVYVDQFVNKEKSGRVLAYDSSEFSVILSNVTELTQTEMTTLIIRDLSGKPHLLTVRNTETVQMNGKSYLKCYLSSELPFKWSKFIGSKYEYPYFVAGSDKLMLCWVQNVTNSGNTCTVKLVNYDSRVYKKDITLKNGWGHCMWGHGSWGHGYN